MKPARETFIQLEVPGEEGYDLTITTGSGDHVEVWLDTEVQEFDGLCIGIGGNRSIAVADAIRTLKAAVRRLVRLSKSTKPRGRQ